MNKHTQRVLECIKWRGKKASSSQFDCVFKGEPASQRVKSKMAAYSPPRKTGKRGLRSAFLPPPSTVHWAFSRMYNRWRNIRQRKLQFQMAIVCLSRVWKNYFYVITMPFKISTTKQHICRTIPKPNWINTITNILNVLRKMMKLRYKFNITLGELYIYIRITLYSILQCIELYFKICGIRIVTERKSRTCLDNFITIERSIL
jgi:hypothetical protein